MTTSSRSPRRGNPRGRPPKFSEPSRPITVTLPERTIEILARLGDDRARSIVAVADAFAAGQGMPRAPVEIQHVGSGIAVILSGPCRPLATIPNLRMIEICPGRSLLTITPGTATENLEVEVADLLDSASPSPDERAVLEGLLQVLRSQRRRKSISKAEILFVQTP